MVGVEDEQDVERLLEDRVDLVVGRHLEDHREEVAHVALVGAGVDVGPTLRVAVGPGGQRRNLGDQPDDVQAARLWILDLVHGLRVEGAERRDRADQHRHRVGVVAEPVEELLHVLVDERVVVDPVDERLVRLLARQLALEDQLRDLEEVGLLGELLDRVAAVAQDPLAAVDERDPALARRRVLVARVVGHHAEVAFAGLDLPQVHRVDVAVDQRELVRLPGAVIGDRQSVGHGSPRCCETQPCPWAYRRRPSGAGRRS